MNLYCYECQIVLNNSTSTELVFILILLIAVIKSKDIDKKRFKLLSKKIKHKRKTTLLFIQRLLWKIK